MILIFAAALAAVAPTSSTACPSVVTPEAFICHALEAQKAGDPQAAAQAFEQAALASSDKEPATARMFAAAGNMWIAANQPAKATIDLDKAVAMRGLSSAQRSEALLDGARAAEAQNDLKTARAKLTLAAPGIAGADPFYWYFSAALAVREGDAATAKSSIAKALALAPGDPTILFEAGHVAHLTGDDVKARSYWQQAIAADPNGVAGRSAAKAAELLGVIPTVVTR